MRRYLTPKQVARQFGFDVSTVQRRLGIFQGLTLYDFGPRSKRFDADEIAALDARIRDQKRAEQLREESVTQRHLHIVAR